MIEISKYILGSIILIYIGFSIYRNNKPRTYDSNFNQTREQIGMEIIQTDWINQNSDNSVYQIWIPKEIKEIGFFKKYINCDSWDGSIVAEIDTYRVEVDSTTFILSIQYIFSKNRENKMLIQLKELNIPPGKVELFGYPSNSIKSIEQDEAELILEYNKINKIWPQQLSYNEAKKGFASL